MRIALGVLLILCMVSAAHAVVTVGTVTYTLHIDASGPGTWSLYADDSLDNGGISLWGVRINNVNELAVIDAPFIQYVQSGLKTVGLHFSENSDFDPSNLGMASDGIARVSIGSSQELPSMPAVFGFGQDASASPLTVPGGGTYVDSRNNPLQSVPYAAHLLLAHGTYNGIAPVFAASGNIANVFLSTGNPTSPAGANVITQVIPEPSTVLLIATLLTLSSRARFKRNAA